MRFSTNSIPTWRQSQYTLIGCYYISTQTGANSLSSIGPTTYSLICDLAAPTNPKTLTLPAIAQLLKDHFVPKRLIIAERFTFHRRNQRPGETMTEYDAALRKLAVTCEFEACLEEAIHDRLVRGLRGEAIQRRLLSEPKLTLAKAMELAQGIQAADHSSRRLKGQEQHIIKVTGTSGKQGKKQPTVMLQTRKIKPHPCGMQIQGLHLQCVWKEGTHSSSLSF